MGQFFLSILKIGLSFATLQAFRKVMQVTERVQLPLK